MNVRDGSLSTESSGVCRSPSSASPPERTFLERVGALEGARSRAYYGLHEDRQEAPALAGDPPPQEGRAAHHSPRTRRQDGRGGGDPRAGHYRCLGASPDRGSEGG